MTNNHLTPENIYLFHQGKYFHSYQMLGAHLEVLNGQEGVRFTLWAPNAREVFVVGDFNNWQSRTTPLEKVNNSGIWAIFVPGLKEGELYKYEIHTFNNEKILKADPYGFYSENRPGTASRVFNLNGYQWQDQKWQKSKKQKNIYESPILIYEVHLGSWRRKESDQFYSYRELAHELVDYVKEMGYTHIELLPIMEHPFDGSWGYQLTGYYAVTSRYGNPYDFMYFVDCCHQKGIGVILDWVPGHFCKDCHGLANFDGTPLFEGEEQLQWGTLKFNFAKPEVVSFLISNAVFWFDVFHLDGLRIDAVACMLYLDYGNEKGQWRANIYGGRENLEAIAFMKKLNEVIFHYFPQALMIAEESTDWPMVTSPTYVGGLGYNFKWNMGWMNDILQYMEIDPVYRKWHHNLITFSLTYAFSENFVLPLSHDEVVHGKKSLIEKMPGDYWQKFANLRVLLMYMMAHPGKKLLFMGGEFAQFIEWRFYSELDWFLLDYEMHNKFHQFVQKLNNLYLNENSLWEQDDSWSGFTWIDPNNHDQSIIVFLRIAKNKDFLIVVLNFTPVVYKNYRIGVPQLGFYKEVFNSDRETFGGSGQNNIDIELKAEKKRWHNQPYSLEITVPPLAGVFLKKVDEENSNL
ncbi:MAG: 1,4-alpha-glucan branching enzyme [Clostridia bacterium]|nr:1,4-alpha-glucan branching enzyme [Clostridia bacterium]